MAKAVWNGFLRLSLVSCPVRLSPAIAEAKGPRLEQLNGRTGNPVTQQFLDAKTGDVVAADAVAKGAAVEGGSYVALSEKELAGLSEEPSNIIDVMQFVPAGRVDRALLETRYYIYPEDELASDTLHAVWVAMQRSSRVGIGRVHLAERGRFVLVEPYGSGLIASTLRNPSELAPAEFKDRAEQHIPSEMIEIAEGIIGRRAVDFSTDLLRDPYEQKLRALIDEKARAARHAAASSSPAPAAPAPAPTPPPPATLAPPAAAAKPAQPQAATPPTPPPPAASPRPTAAAEAEPQKPVPAVEPTTPATSPAQPAPAAAPAPPPQPAPAAAPQPTAPPPPPAAAAASPAAPPTPQPPAAGPPPAPPPQPAPAASAPTPPPPPAPPAAPPPAPPPQPAPAASPPTPPPPPAPPAATPPAPPPQPVPAASAPPPPAQSKPEPAAIPAVASAPPPPAPPPRVEAAPAQPAAQAPAQTPAPPPPAATPASTAAPRPEPPPSPPLPPPSPPPLARASALAPAKAEAPPEPAEGATETAVEVETEAQPEEAGAREVGTEILLHIMGLGDRRYVEPGWAGHPGSRRQIEAISIRPRLGLPPSTVEFRVFAQEGRATAWVSNGNYAGTRGRGLPLTGFAVRPTAELRDKVDIIYEACFFEGGVVGPRRNGELCVSPVDNDPLEAVRVSIYERQ